jgi:hypothetical protein
MQKVCFHVQLTLFSLQENDKIWKTGGIKKVEFVGDLKVVLFSNVVRTDRFRETGLLSKSRPFREELSILGKN